MRMLGVGLALVIAGSAWAQEEPLGPEEFLRLALHDAIADVEAGRAARTTMGTPPSVQQLGRQIIDETMARNDDLTRLAQEYGVVVTNQLLPEDRQAIEAMNKLKGEDFTHAYLRYLMTDLQQDLALYGNAARTLPEQRLRELAGEALPGLERNLMAARTVYDAQVAQTPR
jgi:predicted outer membrane protein